MNFDIKELKNKVSELNFNKSINYLILYYDSNLVICGLIDLNILPKKTLLYDLYNDLECYKNDPSNNDNSLYIVLYNEIITKIEKSKSKYFYIQFNNLCAKSVKHEQIYNLIDDINKRITR